MIKEKFSGVGVALVTPFNVDFSIDYTNLEKIITRCISGGVHYLVVQGTTGESPTISWEEQLEILSFVIEKVQGAIPVVFGLGGNNTKEIVDKTQVINKYKIDAILSVAPYYNKPNQKGIIKHFESIADASSHPVILYNIPLRSACNIEASSTIHLSNHPNIIAIKEASRDLVQCKKIIESKNNQFELISGDDELSLKLMRLGGIGVISVLGNLFPEQIAKMVNFGLIDEWSKAALIDKKFQTAYPLLSDEGNPTSIKTALELQGICKKAVRLPNFEGSSVLEKKWNKFFNKFER